EALYNDFKGEHGSLYLCHGQLGAGGYYALLFCTSGFELVSITTVLGWFSNYEGIWNLVDFVQESCPAGRDHKPTRSLVLL
ncbi:hypothetical protein V1525DRAFT_323316, partial [Lipomyces kononenkoae]